MMGKYQLGCPAEIALPLRDAAQLEAFIETGTFKGGTTVWAAQHFKQVYTVEGYRPRFEKTAAAFAGQHQNISWRFGDSRDELKRILYEWGEPALFWLDAHWCGNGPANANGSECPIDFELDAINTDYYAEEHVILIDDARYFIGRPPHPHDPEQWPTFKQLELRLQHVPRYVTIHKDVIIAVPLYLKPVVQAIERQIK